jgi:hypothetical protein
MKMKAIQAAVAVLLVVALTGHVVWVLLQPLMPSLIILVVLALVYRVIFRGRD